MEGDRNGLLVEVELEEKKEELIATLVDLSEPEVPVHLFDSKADHSQINSCGALSDLTQVPQIIVDRNGNMHPLPEGKEYNEINGFVLYDSVLDLCKRIPVETLNFKGSAFHRYRLYNTAETYSFPALPQSKRNQLEMFFRSSRYLLFAVRSISAAYLRFDSLRNNVEDYISIADREMMDCGPPRSRMPYEKLTLVKEQLSFRLLNSYRCPPLRGYELDFRRLILVQLWPCKPDILRWRAAVDS